jgi:hypothetical protein
MIREGKSLEDIAKWIPSLWNELLYSVQRISLGLDSHYYVIPLANE